MVRRILVPLCLPRDTGLKWVSLLSLTRGPLGASLQNHFANTCSLSQRVVLKGVNHIYQGSSRVPGAPSVVSLCVGSEPRCSLADYKKTHFVNVIVP